MRERVEVGKDYGAFQIISIDENYPTKNRHYITKCLNCGKVFSLTGQNILKYQNRGCLDCRKNENREKREDDARKYIGKTYGDLEIIGLSGIQEKSNRSVVMMACRCHKCQKITEVPLPRLKSGGAKECAKCAQKNLKMGGEIVKSASIDGTLITAIDGRRKKNKNNSSGYNGISWSKQTSKWRAYINFRRKQYSLGSYDKIEDAINARKSAEKEIYGSFLDWYAENYSEQWEKVQKRNCEDKIRKQK